MAPAQDQWVGDSRPFVTAHSLGFIKHRWGRCYDLLLVILTRKCLAFHGKLWLDRWGNTEGGFDTQQILSLA